MMMMMSQDYRFRSMVEEGVDRSFHTNLPNFASEITRLLGEMEGVMKSPRRNHAYAFFQLNWAQGLEESSANVIKHMAANRDRCRHGAAHFAVREPALVEALCGKAAWSDATLAELVEIAASAHRLRVMCLKMLAAAEEDDIVCVAATEYLAYFAEEELAYMAEEELDYTPHDGDSIPAFPYEAVVGHLDAAVAAGTRDPDVMLFMEGFAERAGKLRRGAAELGGEDAVKLREHAATIEALCADTETFLHKIVSSPYVDMCRFLIHRETAPGEPVRR